MSRYAKFFAALVATVALAGQLLADGNLSGQDIGLLLTSFAGAAGVFFLRNTEPEAGDDRGTVDVLTVAVIVVLVLLAIYIAQRI